MYLDGSVPLEDEVFKQMVLMNQQYIYRVKKRLMNETETFKTL